MTERADEELIEDLRGGDLAAFDRLYLRYEHRLFGYIRRIVGDRALAEDLFQEVFLGVLKDRSYDPQRGRFSAWLFTVARNRCLMEQRKRARAQPQTDIVGPDEPALDDTVDRNARVRAAIAELPEPQRQLLLLKQIGELTYKEIAAMFGVAEGTIKSRVHAATKAFRRQMAERGEI